ncbi:SDR family NAD(P)-dependent oxidoreductase [Actinacidiphila sp. ITFR-21]|uniref:SDR family NAD(P)-dependent oxidoreductase n=1 Tax=Actinacidiphila sp. ITFR-21 TaxID=3075199 RepID=UPI00288A5C53|nr:SDR family oxidoreductase [Streptomyces sp. ITFR-21]WNI16778.1 SDR family oxidoreductase [Streptomyces sp. ITFR-21]
MDLGLAGKTAFVTGGSHGIGLAVARGLLAEGAAVVVCGRDERRLAECGVPGVRADVTDYDQLGRAVDEAAERLGGLDLLVANAGGSFGRGLLESTPQQWADTYALNVGHASHAIRCAVPHFGQRGGGAALIISSITGRKPGPHSSYAAAKAAEIHLAAALAQELGPRSIRVNTLSPGSVLFDGGGWDRFRTRHPDVYAAFARDDFPRGRLITLQEVADTACFLLSPRATGVNGADIPVDAAQDHPTAARFFP